MLFCFVFVVATFWANILWLIDQFSIIGMDERRGIPKYWWMNIPLISYFGPLRVYECKSFDNSYNIVLITVRGFCNEILRFQFTKAKWKGWKCSRILVNMVNPVNREREFYLLHAHRAVYRIVNMFVNNIFCTNYRIFFFVYRTIAFVELIVPWIVAKGTRWIEIGSER